MMQWQGGAQMAVELTKECMALQVPVLAASSNICWAQIVFCGLRSKPERPVSNQQDPHKAFGEGEGLMAVWASNAHG